MTRKAAVRRGFFSPCTPSRVCPQQLLRSTLAAQMGDWPTRPAARSGTTARCVYHRNRHHRRGVKTSMTRLYAACVSRAASPSPSASQSPAGVAPAVEPSPAPSFRWTARTPDVPVHFRISRSTLRTPERAIITTRPINSAPTPAAIRTALNGSVATAAVARSRTCSAPD